MNSPPELVTCYAGCGQQYDARDRAACRYHQAHGDAVGANLALLGRRRRRLRAMAKDRHRLLMLLDRCQAERDAAIRGWHHDPAGALTTEAIPDDATAGDVEAALNDALLNLWRPDR